MRNDSLILSVCYRGIRRPAHLLLRQGLLQRRRARVPEFRPPAGGRPSLLRAGLVAGAERLSSLHLALSLRLPPFLSASLFAHSFFHSFLSLLLFTGLFCQPVTLLTLSLCPFLLVCGLSVHIVCHSFSLCLLVYWSVCYLLFDLRFLVLYELCVHSKRFVILLRMIAFV